MVRSGDKMGERSSGGPTGRNFRPFLDDDYWEKRPKGLCFTCNEKYSPDRVYKISKKVDVGG